MKATTIFAAGLPDALRSVAAVAAREAFPGARVLFVQNVAEAAGQPAGGRQVLVMSDSGEADMGLAAQAVDGDGLPRWAALVLGRDSSDTLDCVPAQDCEPRRLARALRSAVLQHDLVRENLRLRGDLKTVARRVRHDLFTPLNCIHLTCEVLADETDAAGVGARVKAVQESLSEVTTLIDRVSAVLAASAEAPSLAPVSMGSVVADVANQLQGELRSKGVGLALPPGWPDAEGVAEWLDIIWWNLISNAIEHGSPSEPIRLGWDKGEGEIRFWVSNRGAAVPPAQEPRLFRRFDRLHAAPAAGLGLPFVQRLVELQGGRCGYERTADGSSLFFFTLPAA